MTSPMAPMSAARIACRDQLLERWAAELIEHDRRVCGLPVRVRFDGAVAHLTGDVEQPEELERLRELLGRLDGVLGVWDRVRVAGRPVVALDLGCGDTLQHPDNIGVDLLRSTATRVIADVSRPLPFATGGIDQIFTVHVLEHLADFLPLIDECHRVLRRGGVLHILAPWWRHVNAVADPTHLRLLDTQTIKGVCARSGSPLRWYPMHVGCDGATVLADLTPQEPGDRHPSRQHLARFFS